MDEQLMTITVADGHTVTGSKTVADPATGFVSTVPCFHGPGKQMQVSSHDAAYLVNAGFVAPVQLVVNPGRQVSVSQLGQEPRTVWPGQTFETDAITAAGLVADGSATAIAAVPHE